MALTKTKVFKLILPFCILTFFTTLSVPPALFSKVISSHTSQPGLYRSEHECVGDILTQKHYYDALQRADAPVFYADFDADFVLLLNDAQLLRYRRLPDLAQKKAFIRKYWKAADPNPLLPENDWLKDFLRRRQYVRENFMIPGTHEYDDRGLYYLKYGKPLRRYYDPGGKQRVSLEGIFYRGVLASRPVEYIDTVPNESWSYDNINRNFVVHFVQEGNRYREAEDLSEAVTFVSGSGKYSIELMARLWYLLLTRRAYLSHDMQDAEQEMLWVLDENAMYAQKMPYLVQRDYERARNLAIEEAPPVAYEPVDAIAKLEMDRWISQFRDREGQTRVEVDIYVAMGKNLIDDLADDDTLAVLFSTLFRDGDFESVQKRDARSVMPLAFARARKISHVTGAVSLLLPAQRGDLTFQVRDVATDKLGFSRQNFKVRAFPADSIVMSDVRFFTQADEALKKVLPVTRVMGLDLVPYPDLELHRSLPLLCYFEIYNFPAENSEDQYELEYKVTALTPARGLVGVLLGKMGLKKTSISSSYEMDSRGRMSAEVLALDLKNLPPGTYTLTVTLSSRKQKNILATAERGFTLK